MNIKQIIEESAGHVSLSIAPIDLQEFASEIYKQGRIDAREEAQRAAATQPKDDPLLTIEEVAKKLRVTRTAIFRWNKKGYLVPTTYAGRHPRYSLSDINKLLAERKRLN